MSAFLLMCGMFTCMHVPYACLTVDMYKDVTNWRLTGWTWRREPSVHQDSRSAGHAAVRERPKLMRALKYWIAMRNMRSSMTHSCLIRCVCVYIYNQKNNSWMIHSCVMICAWSSVAWLPHRSWFIQCLVSATWFFEVCLRSRRCLAFSTSF